MEGGGGGGGGGGSFGLTGDTILSLKECEMPFRPRLEGLSMDADWKAWMAVGLGICSLSLVVSWNMGKSALALPSPPPPLMDRTMEFLRFGVADRISSVGEGDLSGKKSCIPVITIAAAFLVLEPRSSVLVGQQQN